MYTEVGHIIKPHGLKGDMVISLEVVASNNIDTFSALYVDFGGSKVPFKIESINPLRPGQYKIHLSSIDDLESAEKFRKSKTYCLTEEIPSEEEVDLTGFKLQNRGADVGVISTMIDNGLQILLEVSSNDESIYVPFTTDWLIEIDLEEEVVNLDLPEGILDL